MWPFIRKPKYEPPFWFSDERLKWWCTASLEEVQTYCSTAVRIEIPEELGVEEDFLLFQDNGADVLAIAHLDTVQDGVLGYSRRDNIIKSPSLDDRLGAYLIWEVLPQLNIKVDVLLTTGEEIGQSTGMFFDPTKNYRYMFQFDRAGHKHAVCYDYLYTNPEVSWNLMTSLLYAGINVENGIFSDISFMEHVGCKGVNFACGYHDNHWVHAWADLEEVTYTVSHFHTFYRDTLKSTFLHNPMRKSEKK